MLDYIKSLFRPRCTWDELLTEYLASSQFGKLAPTSQSPTAASS